MQNKVKRLALSIKAPAAIAFLRVGQMLLGLFSIRLTFEALNPPAFVLFSLVLATVALASAFNNGYYVQLWFRSIAETKALIVPNVIFLALVGLVAALTVELSPQAADLGIGGAVALIFFLQYRFFERMAVVALFSSGRPAASYMLLYATAFLEIGAALACHAIEPSSRLAMRLGAPALIGLALTVAVSIGQRNSKPKVAAELAAKRKSAPVVIYLLLMTLALSAERLAGQWLGAIGQGFEYYLLAHSYALAFIGLVGAIVDWARPGIVESRAKLIPAERKTLILGLAGGTAATALYPLMVELSILPGQFAFSYWVVLMGGSVAAGAAALLQVRFVAEGKFALVVTAWFSCLLFRLSWMALATDPASAAAWSFLIGNLAAFAILAYGYWTMDLKTAAAQP